MTLRIDVASGTDADRWLEDTAFLRAWEELAAACSWTTAFQRPAYACVWYRIYRARYTPVVLAAYDEMQLVGVLALALDTTGRRPVLGHVGLHQAEYHGWITRPKYGATFPAAALQALAHHYPDVERVTFGYLPGGIETSWVEAVRESGLIVELRDHHRALMHVGTTSAIEASLRKSANKSRLSRLQRLGDVRFEQLTSRSALEPLMDEIVRHCDLRHGAIHDVMPFAADPLKREFHLALMDTPGVAHATVLRAGETLVAAHLSVHDPRAVPLGVITYSPLHGSSSPGKLLMLLLGRHLGTQGYEWFDLTAGGDAYKERFASTSDVVTTADVWFNRNAATRVRRRRRFMHAMQRALTPLGTRRASLIASLRHFQQQRAEHGTGAAVMHTMRSIPQHVGRWRSTISEFRIHVMKLERRDGTPNLGRFRLNALDDLLRYRPVGPAGPSRAQFLREALDRLEHGQLAFSYVEDGVLQHCGWLHPAGSRFSTMHGHEYPLLQRAAVLEADYTRSTMHDRDVLRESLQSRCAYAATTSAPYALIAVNADDMATCRNVERLGFSHAGSAWYTRRFGRIERRTAWHGALCVETDAGSLKWIDPTSTKEIAHQ